MTAQRIEDYAVIGDLHTAALVGRNGSVDWLCLPHFDSPSCFSQLLGDESHGFWQLAPAGGADGHCGHPARVPEGLAGPRDRVRHADRAPCGSPTACRCATRTPTSCASSRAWPGTVDMHMDLAVRFDYGEIVPWLTSTDGLIRMTAGPDAVALWHLVDPVGHDLHTVADFTVREGQRFPFTFVWYPSHEEPPPPLDAYYAINLTDAYWKEWAARCTYEGPYRDAVVRSLITLKALTYEPTGGIVAAATTSLPEAIGGSAATGTTATAGCATPRSPWSRSCAAATSTRPWPGATGCCAPWPATCPACRSCTARRGERRLDEWEASWLPGYEASAPVRIGNAASGQFQLDVYGEVMSALYASAHSEGVQSRAAWALQTQLVDFLETGWSEPDDGIWEVRGPRRHFTHSKVMAWVAVDRAVKTLEEWPELEGPLEEWRELRHEIFTEVCEKGYNKEIGSFTQYYDCDQLDASVLMIPLVGFLPPTDPRVISTVEAVEKGCSTTGSSCATAPPTTAPSTG